jgi:glycerol-3-phosphate acyltransferase PlsX
MDVQSLVTIVKKKPRIGVDLMGESVSLPNELIEHYDVEFIVGDEVITMDDDPFSAIRKKKKASLNIALRLLKEGSIDALVSFGNTGALLVGAMTTLSLIEGVSRPALITLIPTKKNPVAVLDVGANVLCKAEHLHQFAKMGIAFQKSCGVPSPKVGLLNIGTEETKGREELKQAYALLSEDPHISFSGNIEGRDIFQGLVDVLVTDGFTGNIFLKTAEGISAFILEKLGEKASTYPEFDYAEYPGALLCGIKGIIIKCHGEFSHKALISAIKKAAELVSEGFLNNVNSFYTSKSNAT